MRIEEIKHKILYVDFDGVLCRSEVFTEGELDYNYSEPNIENISKVNLLYNNNRIVIWTARGKRTGKIDWRELTVKQLAEWGVKYHQVSFVKPHFDILIDDKSFNNLDSFI